MKKITITMVLLSMVFYCKAQTNLITNGSFELYDSLPTTKYHEFLVSYVSDWYVPHECDVFYFHKNATNKNLALPQNMFGKTNPHSGDACIGIKPYKWICDISHYSTKLKKRMIAGKKYYVEMYTKFARETSDYGTNSIEFLFHFEQYPFPHIDYYDYSWLIDSTMKSEIIYDTYPNLMDTGWVKISGIYIANGTERFLTIGKFYDPKITSFIENKFRRIGQKSVYWSDERRRKSYDRFDKKYQYIIPINYPVWSKGSKKTRVDSFYYIDDISVIELSDKK